MQKFLRMEKLVTVRTQAIATNKLAMEVAILLVAVTALFYNRVSSPSRYWIKQLVNSYQEDEDNIRE